MFLGEFPDEDKTPYSDTKPVAVFMKEKYTDKKWFKAELVRHAHSLLVQTCITPPSGLGGGSTRRASGRIRRDKGR